MALGERLRQARLEAGLSQRQLCGDEITRNMLSQIENGSARPSMDTLRYLACQLGKPISYFLEEQAAVSPNQAVMDRARQAKGTDVLEALAQYRAPDAVFDRERWLLEVLTCLELAEQAIGQQKPGYAAALLEQARKAGQATPYYTPDLERRRLLLCFEAGTPPAQLVSGLPDNTSELLLRAQAALEEGSPQRCAAALDAAQTRTPCWHFLRARALEEQGLYSEAAEQYLQAEEYAPRKVYAHLERCYRELEDYKQAYFYACKQR